jgi:outer membrane protein OmpA-like peptidoglycan-associated protein
VPYLDSVGEMLSMQRMRDNRILIAGHADASGDPSFNRRLSEQRALAARDYLVARYGIGPDRLSVVGHGEPQPLPGTDPYDGINRRVEFQPLQ